MVVFFGLVYFKKVCYKDLFKNTVFVRDDLFSLV